jgi:CTP synthase
MVDRFEKMGISFVGKDSSGQRMEIMNLNAHPWFGMTSARSRLGEG